MQIWSRNDSQWIINEDEAAEQKPCNSSRDSLMFRFTPDKSWRRDWIYGHSKFCKNTGVIHQLYRQSNNLPDCLAYTSIETFNVNLQWIIN